MVASPKALSDHADKVIGGGSVKLFCEPACLVRVSVGTTERQV